MLIIILGDNMNILFTGAVSGIASATIQKLIKNKNNIIFLTVRTESQLKTVLKKYKDNKNVKCFKLDITKKNDREKLKKLDIDVLVNNAAVCYGGSIAEIPFSKVRENFEVNVFASFQVVQIVLKNMIKKDRGRIIIMGSLAGIIPIDFLGVYSATKSSIITLATTLKNELKLISDNIKIVLIEPGFYHTGFNQVMMDNKFDWMIQKSYFKDQLNNIRKKEKLLLSIMEKRNLDSITTKIIDAINSPKPKFIYRAPISQVIGAKLYQILKK